MKQIRKNELDDIVSSGKKIVVDIFAEWCQPCNKIKLYLEKISQNFPEIEFLSIDAESETDLVEKYSISSLPTLLFFSNGSLTNKTVGLIGEASLERLLQKL